MVADDDVDPGGVELSDGVHRASAAIARDYDLGVAVDGGLDACGAEIVTVGDAMWDEWKCVAAEAANSASEQCGGTDAIYVVIAVYHDHLAVGDGANEALDGDIEATHRQSIVQLIQTGAKEQLGLLGGRMSTKGE